MDVEALANCVLDAKQGNREMAIFYQPFYKSHAGEILGGWSVELGNLNPNVMLGEIAGEVCSEQHHSIEAALNELLERLNDS